MNRRDFLRNCAIAAGNAGVLHSALQAGVKLSNNSMDFRLGRNRPNVIFILADDLGYNHLGCYGQTRARTPNIDKLASEGVRFTQAYSGCTVCGPSRAALMSGLHVGHVPYRNNTGYVPLTTQKTIAEIFKDAGYTNGYFGKYALGAPGTDQIPRQRGYDQFWGILHQEHGHYHFSRYVWYNETKYILPNTVRPYTQDGEDFGLSSLTASQRVIHTDEVFEEKALEFIEQNANRPFFCFVSFDIPHTEMWARESSTAPYRTLDWSAYEYNSINNGYHVPTSSPCANFAGMLGQIDEVVGEIVKKLDNLGIADNTLVIFTSDNGGQLNETWGDTPSEFFQANGILRKGKTWNYEGGIRVPFIARWPGKIKPNTTGDHPCYFPDVMPTFADILGVEPPANIDGLSFLPALLGKPNTQHNFMYWEHPVFNGGLITTQVRQAVRMGKWKGLRERTTDTDSAIELYDLDADISETTDVSASNMSIVTQIRDIMNAEHETPLG